MNGLKLFVDGSVNTLSKEGCGAYLLMQKHEVPNASLKTRVKVKRFEQTSSTKLELQTLLWALGENEVVGSELVVYTDSQNILSLRGRRQRLEENGYRTKENMHLSNKELYQAFYLLTDQLNIEFIKVSGHMPRHAKTEVDELFTLVDRASRKALREMM